jgi:hypothetical protein
VSLCFERQSIPKLRIDVVKSEFASYAGVQSLFNAAAQQIDGFNLLSGEHAGQTVAFGIRLELAGFQLSGEPVIQVAFSGKVRLVSRNVFPKAVLAYGEPTEEAGARQVNIETFAAGDSGYSGACRSHIPRSNRSSVPRQTDHAFRGMPISRSEVKPIRNVRLSE